MHSDGAQRVGWIMGYENNDTYFSPAEYAMVALTVVVLYHVTSSPRNNCRPICSLSFSPTLAKHQKPEFIALTTNPDNTAVNMPTRYAQDVAILQCASLTVIVQVNQDSQAPRPRFRRSRSCRKAR